MSYSHLLVRWCQRCASVYELHVSTPISRVMLSEMRLCLRAIHTYQSGDVRDAPLFMSYSHLSVGWCQRCASAYELFTPISRVMSEMRLCLWAIHTYQSGDVRDAPLFMSYSHLSVGWCQRCASAYELFTPISRVMSEMRLCLWAIHTYQSGDARDAPLFMSYSHLSVGWCQRCASVYELFTPISPVMSEVRLCLWAIHTYQSGVVRGAPLLMSYSHLSVGWCQRCASAYELFTPISRVMSEVRLCLWTIHTYQSGDARDAPLFVSYSHLLVRWCQRCASVYELHVSTPISLVMSAMRLYLWVIHTYQFGDFRDSLRLCVWTIHTYQFGDMRDGHLYMSYPHLSVWWYERWSSIYQLPTPIRLVMWEMLLYIWAIHTYQVGDVRDGPLYMSYPHLSGWWCERWSSIYELSTPIRLVMWEMFLYIWAIDTYQFGDVRDGPLYMSYPHLSGWWCERCSSIYELSTPIRLVMWEMVLYIWAIHTYQAGDVRDVPLYMSYPHLSGWWCERWSSIYELSTPIRLVMWEMFLHIWAIHTYQVGDVRDVPLYMSYPHLSGWWCERWSSIYELSTPIRLVMWEVVLYIWAIHTYQAGDVRGAPLFMNYSHLSVGWCQRCASVCELFTPISPVMSEMRLCLWATCIHTYQFGDVSDASLFMSYPHLSVWWFQR